MTRAKRFAYSAPFVPAEWIAAHGCLPRFHRPSGVITDGPIDDRAGLCAYMRAFVNEVSADSSIDGLILTTTCDQMRRAVDLIADGSAKPVFLMHVPTTWQTSTAYQYYLDELDRLGRFLVDQGGSTPSNGELIDVMRGFERGRQQIVATPERCRGQALSTALNGLFEGALPPAPPTEVRRGVPIAVLGGPLSKTDCQLFELIHAEGGTVLLDGTENGERGLPGKFNARQLAGEPLQVLADAYFGSIVDVFQRPNNRLFAWLKGQVKERGIEGIVLVRYVWCDCWHAEVQRIREWVGVPLVDIDLNGIDGAARNTTRIAAFLEALR